MSPPTAKKKAPPKKKPSSKKQKGATAKVAPAKVAKARAEERPKKAPKPKKQTEPKREPRPKAEKVKLGTAPVALVESRHLDSMHEREARGFSFGELSSAGVSLSIAKGNGLSLDVRRRSVHEGNVERLKGWLGAKAAQRKSQA